ncbi:hypothetical protein Leryth_023067 [Lithospermum erythrorhizon]|nr:hypothetical protein Leryth_023067 [Lithospermum erythrorhizon]
MVSSASFLRQLSGKEGWKSSSKRWSKTNYCEGYGESRLKQMEGLSSMCGNMNGLMVMRKRVMVVVDQTSQSKDAMMWALTHITNKSTDVSLCILLQVLSITLALYFTSSLTLVRSVNLANPRSVLVLHRCSNCLKLVVGSKVVDIDTRSFWVKAPYSNGPSHMKKAGGLCACFGSKEIHCITKLYMWKQPSRGICRTMYQ